MAFLSNYTIHVIMLVDMLHILNEHNIFGHTFKKCGEAKNYLNGSN